MISDLIRWVRASDFARNIAVLTSGTILAQGIGLIATPILSRIYTPADYGLVAIFSAVVAICATLITARYEITVLLPTEENKARSIAALAVLLAILVGGILAVCATIIPEHVRVWLGVQALGLWLPISVLCGIATAITAVITNWLNRCCEYRKISSLRIIQAIISVLSGLTFGFLAVPNGLMYAQAVTITISALLFLFFSHTTSDVYKSSTQSLLDAALEYRRAPTYLLPTAMLDVCTLQLPFILISVWFTSELTGHYRMAWALLGLPAGLVGSATAQVFYQRFSQLWPDAAAAKALLIKTWIMLAILGAIPFAMVMLFGKQLFLFVLGPAWAETGRMAALMAPMFFAWLLSSTTSPAFVVMRMERTVLFFSIAVVIYRPFCLYLGHYFDNIYLGLGLFVVAEIIQVLAFQYLVIRKLRTAQKVGI
jgi:O-antigen/teichoic acid export membrane protein